MKFNSPLLLAIAAASTTVLAGPNCPPLGPVFPKPTNLASSPPIRAALDNLTTVLSARDNDNSAAVLANSTSWSIEVFSANPDTPTLFEWHHTAPELAAATGNNSFGVKKVDGDTVYRLGSLTKVFTVYTWLAQDGMDKWNEPITKYVPELREAAARAKAAKDPVKNVPWDEVTIGSLAGQMSGAIRDYGLMGEMTQQYGQDVAVALGFPPLNSSDPTLPPCGAWPLCNRTGIVPWLLNLSQFLSFWWIYSDSLASKQNSSTASSKPTLPTHLSPARHTPTRATKSSPTPSKASKENHSSR